MFGKTLRRELKQYLRKLWPYALALAVASVIGYLLVLLDKNEIESWGIVLASPIFAVAAVAYVSQIYIRAYVSFYKNFPCELEENRQYACKLLWTKILAFVTVICISFLIFFACVSISVWGRIAKMFEAFAENWYYIVEFLLYIAVVTFTVYILPISNIAAFRFNGKRKISLALSIVTFFFCFGVSVILEIMLLIHSPSTDMASLWPTVIFLLIMFVIADVSACIMTFLTIKKTVCAQQTDVDT